jgi:CDP-paratose 2-epimerase
MRPHTRIERAPRARVLRRPPSWRGDLDGRERPTLITGAVGFIGTNLSHRLLSTGAPVLLFDNLSRPGVDANLRFLRQTYGERANIQVADVRDALALRGAVARAGRVFHFAAQTAVTSSLGDPLHDFEVNARGTLNLLEALRVLEDPPPLVFTSTNKVYGKLADVALSANSTRYEPSDRALCARGISEERPTDFHSPYGCSKGAADQYVLDYARTFDLPALVFRMSCIYGPHQLGTEDQGWVAHFLIRALAGEPITIYGDGLQVRDVLYVDDLVDALLLAQEHMPELQGQVFNIGGGSDNSLSLIELIELIGELDVECKVGFGDWRTGDQRYYVSDTRKFGAATGWSARVGVRAGVARLHRWLTEQRSRPHGARACAAR